MNHKIKLILLFSVLVASCGYFNSPERVAKKFLNAISDEEYDTAREYSTPETDKLIDLMESLSKVSDAGASASGWSVEITGSKIDGETAYVTFVKEGTEEAQELILKKVNGKWLVHITKKDIAAKDVNQNLGSDEEGLFEDEPDGEHSDETTTGGVE